MKFEQPPTSQNKMKSEQTPISKNKMKSEQLQQTESNEV